MILSTTGSPRFLLISDLSCRTISPLKMWALQQEMQNEETNAPGRQNEILPEMEADRAIHMVKRKLCSRLIDEADVRRLIIEATDEGNLSRMYCGIIVRYILC